MIIEPSDDMIPFIKRYGAVKIHEKWIIMDHEQALMMLDKLDEYRYDDLGNQE
jgi:hypothetical protein